MELTKKEMEIISSLRNNKENKISECVTDLKAELRNAVEKSILSSEGEVNSNIKMHKNILKDIEKIKKIHPDYKIVADLGPVIDKKSNIEIHPEYTIDNILRGSDFTKEEKNEIVSAVLKNFNMSNMRITDTVLLKTCYLKLDIKHNDDSFRINFYLKGNNIVYNSYQITDTSREYKNLGTLYKRAIEKFEEKDQIME